MRIKSTFAALSAAALLTTGAIAASHGGALDADGDGMLTEEEFTPIADMGASFAAYDSDSDGMVSQEEYNEGIRSLANPEDGEETEEVLKKRDELSRMFTGAGDEAMEKTSN